MSEQPGTIMPSYGKIYITDNDALNRFCEENSSFEPIAARYSEEDSS